MPRNIVDSEPDLTDVTLEVAKHLKDYYGYDVLKAYLERIRKRIEERDAPPPTLRLVNSPSTGQHRKGA